MLLEDCSSGVEEVVEGSLVHLHRGRTIEPLEFQPGDVLGMLVRQQSSADITPLVVEVEDKSTGYRRERNGVFQTGSSTSACTRVTSFSPLLALTLCESLCRASYNSL